MLPLRSVHTFATLLVVLPGGVRGAPRLVVVVVGITCPRSGGGRGGVGDGGDPVGAQAGEEDEREPEARDARGEVDGRGRGGPAPAERADRGRREEEHLDREVPEQHGFEEPLVVARARRCEEARRDVPDHRAVTHHRHHARRRPAREPLADHLRLAPRHQSVHDAHRRRRDDAKRAHRGARRPAPWTTRVGGRCRPGRGVQAGALVIVRGRCGLVVTRADKRGDAQRKTEPQRVAPPPRGPRRRHEA
mmetsp:Transcript_12380/g.49874  ORF Transcript_12380/g.49874 Transcript_12380/m.49874 type:complete len:248 (+) Transcript_12380:1211-1954(+)